MNQAARSVAALQANSLAWLVTPSLDWEGKSMQKQLSEDIKEAVDLLKKSEKEIHHSLRTRAFEDAVDLLNDHMSVATDSPYKSFIENIKISYTRKFLEELSTLFSVDIDTWFDYVRLFLLKVPKEVKVNIEKDAQLKDNYKKFIGIWRKEAIEILEL